MLSVLLVYKSLTNAVSKELWLYNTTAITLVNIYNLRGKFSVIYCMERCYGKMHSYHFYFKNGQ